MLNYFRILQFTSNYGKQISCFGCGTKKYNRRDLKERGSLSVRTEEVTKAHEEGSKIDDERYERGVKNTEKIH